MNAFHPHLILNHVPVPGTVLGLGLLVFAGISHHIVEAHEEAAEAAVISGTP